MPSRRRIERLQDRGWQILNGAKIRSRLSRTVNWVLLTLILLNVIAVSLETVSSLQVRFGEWFWTFELVSVAAFGCEYLLRLWCVPAGPRVTARRLAQARESGDAEEIAARERDLEEETGSRLRWIVSPMGCRYCTPKTTSDTEAAHPRFRRHLGTHQQDR